MKYESALCEIVRQDERYVIITAEDRTAIQNLPEILDTRFVDTGVSQQALIGMAAGLALRGRIPIVHGQAAFLTMRAFEFIRTDVGLGHLPVKLIGRISGFLSEANGPTHQAIEDIALMRMIPGMQIFCPADEQDLVQGLGQVLESPHPCYIRHNPLPAIIDHEPNFAFGQAETISDGGDAAILVYGTLFAQAYEAMKRLQAMGFSIRLLNLRSLKPLDEPAVLAAACETDLLVTIEDHFLSGGLYSIVSELLTINQVGTTVLPLALNGHWFRPGLFDEVLAYEGFSGPQLARKIARRLTNKELTPTDGSRAWVSVKDKRYDYATLRDTTAA